MLVRKYETNKIITIGNAFYFRTRQDSGVLAKGNICRWKFTSPLHA
jgi:hypothetical protein